MKKQFQKVAIFGRLRRNGIADTISALLLSLEKNKKTVFVETNTAKLLPKRKNLRLIKQDAIGKNIDLIITVGGDGTMLNVAKIAAKTKTPVLGINRGYLGFLTDIKPEKLADIAAIFAGKYRLEERFLLQVEVYLRNKIIAQDLALNDIVLGYSDNNKMIEFTTTINRELVCTHRADGLIIATPTGSTAYALSGGGPIVHPDLDAIALVPMFPHNLSSRPIVISGKSAIAICIAEKNREPAYINCDGQKSIKVPPSGVIKITKAKEKLQLIHPLTYNYFETLRSKLYWERL